MNSNPITATPSHRGARWGRGAILTLLGLALVLLHQDFWNWHLIRPLIFGFLPIGLAYQAAYSLACALFMALLVRWAWPTHLEQVQEHPSTQSPPH